MSTRLVTLSEIPKYMNWMADNPFILKHYRPPTRSFITCIISSVSQFHTETLNIITHLVPTLVTLYTLIYFWVSNFHTTISLFHHEIRWEHVSVMDKFIISLLLCFSMCFGISALFHTFCCHIDYGGLLALADIYGIIFAVFCFGITSNYFALYTYNYLFWTNTIINVLIIFLFLILIQKGFVLSSQSKNRQTLIFAIFANLTFFPSLFYLIIFSQVEAHNSIYIMFITFQCFGFSGAALYTLKIPESRKPGHFDI